MAGRADIGQSMEACFETIRTTRMAGIPILNEALSVRVIGGRAWNGHFLCVLLTPWFMNLMLVPDDAGGDAVATGTKRDFAFPAGRFEFIRGDEEAIGPYWMCSLFSPVFEFSDQETAEAAGVAVLEALFETGSETDASEMAMTQMWRGDIPEPGESTEADDDTAEARAEKPDLSRRAFLTGGRGEERP